MFYASVYILFISCIVLLVKIIKSVSKLRDSVNVISQCLDELSGGWMVESDELKDTLADCRLSLLELKKELIR